MTIHSSSLCSLLFHGTSLFVTIYLPPLGETEAQLSFAFSESKIAGSPGVRV